MTRHSAYCRGCPHNCVIQAEVLEPDNLDGTTFCVMGWTNTKAYFKLIK